MAKIGMKQTSEMGRDQLLQAYLAVHGELEFQEWTGNGRAKVVDSQTGEVSSLTQRQLRNEVSGLEQDALDDILAAAIPDGVADTTGTSGSQGAEGSGSEAVPAASAAEAGEEGGEESGEGTAALSSSEGGEDAEAADAAAGAGTGDDGAGAADGDAEGDAAAAGDDADSGDEEAAAEAEGGADDAGDDAEDAGAEGAGDDEEVSETRQAFTERLKNEGGGLANQLAQLVESFKEHNRHEKRGSLAKGGDLYNIDVVTQQMKDQGLLKSKEDVARAVRTSFETLGMKLPGPSQRSQMKTTYEKWVVNTGADIDQEFTSEYWRDEDGAPVTKSPDSDELMPLRMTDIGDYRMLERTKNVVTPENMADLLAFLKMNTWVVIAKLSKHLTAENLESVMSTFQGMGEEQKLAWIARQEGVEFKKPSEWASFSIARPVFEKFVNDTMPLLTRVVQQATPEKVGEEGEEPRISKTVAIEYFNEMLGYFTEEYLTLLAKHMWGTMTPEEFPLLFNMTAEEYAAQQAEQQVEAGDVIVTDQAPEGEAELEDAFGEEAEEGDENLDEAFAE